jgi:multimeric flavodoxin WrbA
MNSFLEYSNEKTKKKVVLILGSARSPDCCPNEKSKTHKIGERIQKEFNNKVKFEVVDLSVKCDGINVLPCKACTSTSAFHCHFPCDCYSKESDPKDLMHQQDVYKKLQNCDGFFVLTPINWSSCSSVVKSFFDRLVCVNLTMTSEEAQKILGKNDIKNSKKTRAIEKQGLHSNLLKNHLEGKVAGFFAHGNEGGADYKEFAKNKTKSLPVIPESLIEYEENHKKEDVTKLLDPLVRQCVYSGIRVPDQCVKVVTYGYGISYSEVNDLFEKEERLYLEAKKIMTNLLSALNYN